LAQRRGFREYLAGLLAPRERNKTLTALAGAEPVAGAQHPAVQRLQFFLPESRWDPDRVNERRLELLRTDPAAAPHDAGVLVIDDSGDRKDGTKTAHVGHQWLGRYGKTDSGVVAVTTLWAAGRLYYPVHAEPYTPARHFAKGKTDPGFRTRLQIGAGLAIRARAAGFAFRAVVAGSAYGDQDGFRGELAEAGLPFVMALKPRRGIWAYGPDAHTPVDAARRLAWNDPVRSSSLMSSLRLRAAPATSRAVSRRPDAEASSIRHPRKSRRMSSEAYAVTRASRSGAGISACLVF
jgi:SRSO17 transposase